MDRDEVEVNKHAKKRTSLVNKGFIIGKKNTINLRDIAGNPERRAR